MENRRLLLVLITLTFLILLITGCGSNNIVKIATFVRDFSVLEYDASTLKLDFERNLISKGQEVILVLFLENQTFKNLLIILLCLLISML